jgi:glycosyltransferase involved in cell wall biosynthesis
VSLAVYAELRRQVRVRRHDVIHTHLVHADWHAAAATVGISARPGLVSTKHNHDRFRRRTPFRQVERTVCGRFHETISISHSLHDFVLLWASTPSTVIHYGLPCPRDVPERSSVAPRALLAVGRLEPQKGMDVLVLAMAEVARAFPDVLLRIAGEGSEQGRLEELIGRHGLGKHVKLLGQRDNVDQLMAESHLFVHPARWEGFGLVLLEAMRAALPIVATRVGAIPEVLGPDGEAGLLVSPDKPGEMAQAMLRVMSDTEAAGALGTAGFHRLRQHFDPVRMAAATAEVYDRLIQARPLGLTATAR